MSKSTSTIMNWIQTLWTRESRSSGRSRARRVQRPMQAEMLEVRELLSAILLDIPTIDGNAGIVGATATEMKIDGFSWGFRRDASSATNPLTAKNLSFIKQADSVSPDLFANAAYGADTTTAAKVRIVDDLNGGREVLSLSLSNPKLTGYSTSTVQGTAGEAGTLAFSKMILSQTAYNASNVANKRNANWNLLNGVVTNNPIAGPGNIDVGNNTTLQTVLEIGGEKLLIDEYDWSSTLGHTVGTTSLKVGNRSTGEFKVSRSLDTGTAGLLGSAAAGTVFSKITVTDRRAKLVGGNEVYLQFDLYDAFISDFGIAAKSSTQATNGLGFGYSKIDVTYLETDSRGIVTPLKSTWDSVAKTGVGAAFVTDPNITTNSNSSFLDFGGAKVKYTDLAWSTAKPTTLEGVNKLVPGKFTQGPTAFSNMQVNMPIGPAAAGLIGNLFTGKIHTTVEATELNALTPSLTTDNWTLSSTLVSEFSISSTNTAEPKVKFALAFAKAAETFATTVVTKTGSNTTGSKRFTTTADYSRATQTSSLASTTPIDFGGLTATTTNPGSTNKVPALNTETFVLTITENGEVSDIPVNEASWGVSRDITARTTTARGGSDPSQTDFTIKADRGLHSPGLFLASTRGDEIDKATLRRFEIVNRERVETYRWEMQSVYFTSYSNSMLPGAPASEFDQVSLRSKQVALVSNELDKAGVGKSFGVAWDFTTAAPEGISVPAAKDELGFLVEGEDLVFGARLSDKRFANIDSYQWGAAFSVKASGKTGTRELGAADASPVSISLTGRPSTFLLQLALEAEEKGIRAELKANPEVVNSTLNGMLVNSYNYKDTNSSSGAEVKSGFDFVTAEAAFVPRNAKGQPETPIAVTWDRDAGKTTGNPAFGGFQFNPSAIPAMLLEINDGASKSQLAAQDYSWGVTNPAEQLVGTLASPRPLASRTLTSGQDFLVTTEWDRATPALINAVGSKTTLPEIRIIERRNIPVNGGFEVLPFREWVLNDVYVSKFDTNPTVGNQSGPVTLAFAAGKVTSNLIAYDAAGKLDPKRSNSKSINFIAPPTQSALPLITGISTDPVSTIDIVSRFTDEQEAASALSYSVVVVSGANLFDSVTLNSLNRLLLNYKAGQGGLAQIRVNATDSFGLVGSTLVNVAVDADGINAAPVGTNGTVTTNEDTTYTITAADFGFTDPNDFPVNTFNAVTVSSLPSKGSLTLNNVAVTANQTITVANINSGLLKYAPLPNENGNTYASFQFQVRDNGGVNNVDLSANTLTINVTPVNDAPVLDESDVFLTPISEDTASPAGVLISQLLTGLSDIDASAAKGMAVRAVQNSGGAWQFTLDAGITWTPFGSVNDSRVRLLPANGSTRVRFVPAANTTGTRVIAFAGWDQTSGTAGGTANLTGSGSTGGSTSVSEGLSVARQTVTPVNDAPTLSTANVTLPSINEDTANPAGVLVSSLLTGMTEVDAGAARGIAVRSLQNSSGVWQYSLNGGTNWTPFGSDVSAATARLLPADANTRVRFLASANFSGNRGFNFYAWDQTSGTAGGTVNLLLPGATGGTTAFSTNFAFAIQTIAAVNDTPSVASPATAALVVNTPLVFSTANSNAITVADIDAGSGELQVAFTATDARFTLSTLTGITVTAGTNGTSTFTVRGTLSAINAALAGSSLVGNENFFGSGTLRLEVSDLGNTGSGGAKSSAKTTQFTINALSAATSLGSLDAVSTTGFENGSFTAGTTASSFYSFTLPAAADVRLVLSGLTGNADLRLLTTSGFLINQSAISGNFLENMLVSPLAAGTYIVAVKPTGVATSFNLSVSTATAGDNLIVNANVLGTLNATTLPTVRVSDSVSGNADRQDYFKFTTTVTSPLRVNLSGLSDNYDIRLLDANGVVVSSNVLPGTDIKTIVRSNLAAGDYFISISGLANRNLSSYDLSISLASTSDDSISQAFTLGTLDAATLPVVRRSAPSVGGANIQDYHSFVLASPGDVRVNLTRLSADIDMQLLDSFGRPIGFGSSGGNQSENILGTGLAAGTYYVRVSPFSTSVSSYELSVAMNPTSDDLLTNAVSLGTLSATVPTIQQTGNVNSTSDRIDYYSFTLNATTDVRVNLSGMSGDADILLEDSFGRVLASGVQGGNVIDNLSATALAAGTYLIRVQTSFANTDYLLAVSQTTTSDDLITNATVLPTLTSGTLPTARTNGAVGGSDIQDYYRFDLTTAGNLRFAVSNMTVDLDVQLLDQFGQVIVAGTQSGNTIERVLTPTLAVGTYYIRVFQQPVGGLVSSYNLEITTDFNGDDLIRSGTNLGTLASTALTGGGAVGGAADIQDYHTFTLSSTRNVRFLLTGLSADLDVQIFNSFGNLVGSGTSGSTSTEDFTINGLLAGTYFIRIFPFQTAVSSYSLSVTGV